MRQTAWVTSVGVMMLWLLPRAAAAACNEATAAGLGCFDAEPTTGPVEPSAFRWLSEGKVLSAGSLALGFHYNFSHAPLELSAPSAEPLGRQIPVVKYNSRVEMRAGLGLTKSIDVSLAMPYTIDQEGTGSEALSSQRPTPIRRTGLSDMRVGFRAALPKIDPAVDTSLRLEMTLPTGSPAAYLGETSATEAIAGTTAVTLGSWIVAGEIGVRFRKAQSFSDVSIGTHPFLGAGVAFRILEQERLTVASEFLVRPMLTPQPTLQSSQSIQATSHATWVMPAEWMLSVTSHPTKLPLWVSLGAGTALPLSFRDSPESHVSSSFFAPTSPRARVSTSLTLKY